MEASYAVQKTRSPLLGHGFGLGLALVAVGLSPAATSAQAGNVDFRIVASSDTSIVAGEGAYRIRLASESAVQVQATVETGGRVVRQLFSGVVTDVSDLAWDGFGAGREPVRGETRIHFEVRPADGELRRFVLPLAIEAVGGDTIPLPRMPADTAPIWKRASTLPSIATLAAGLLTGAAAVALPSVVARDGRGAPVRFAIGGTLGLTGVLGFLAQRQDQINEEAVERNRMTREAWQAAINATIEENRERRQITLHIVAGDLLSGGGR